MNNKLVGTSSYLKEGDIISIYELMFGLMLPSGNDSAWALSESIGIILYFMQNNKQRSVIYQIIDVNNYSIVDVQSYFIKEMNKYS